MRIKDLENRQRILFQQLELMETILHGEYREKLGARGYQARVDEILDEIIRNRKLLEAMGKQKEMGKTNSMNITKAKVDADQVLATIDKTLKEIREGLKPEELTVAERASLLKGFWKLETKAHKLKLKIKIDILAAKQPDLSPRKAVVKLLSSLPEDLPASAISELAVFAAEEWESRVGLVAA